MTVIEVPDRVYGPAFRPGGLSRPPALAAPNPWSATGPRHSRPRQHRELVGRDHELAVVADFVDEIAAQGGPLLLSGEPGVGKSALLDAAEDQAVTADVRVLRAAGAQFEDMSYSALNQLLLPLHGDVGRLDCWQRTALNTALGFSDGPAADRLMVSNAALALLRQAAADRPLLLIVDNLPWVDQDSARVLGFLARRMRGSQIGLIAAERSGTSRLPALDLPGCEVRPLGEDESARLVAIRFPGLAPAVRQRIVAEARGNPLALLELPAALSQRQRAARAPLPAALPLNGRLRALLPARVAALPAGAGYLLLLTVLEGTGDLSVLRATAPGQCEAGDLALAEQAGLVHVDGAAQRVVFTHPDIRFAVLEVSASAQVRRAHLALAARLRDQPERRAWHLAGAAVAPDGAAASLLAWGPRPSQGSGQAGLARHFAIAAYLAASVIGDLHAAEALLADARRARPDSDPAPEIALATAFVLLHGDGDLAAAHRLALRGASAMSGGDAGPLGAADALDLLDTISRLSGQSEHRESVKRLTAMLGAAAEPPAEHAAPAEIVRMAGAAVFADRLADWRQALRRVARAEPAGAAWPPSMQASILLALEAYQTGQWDEAWRLAETAASRCASRGYQLLRRQAQTVLALVAASRGDAGTAQALADEVTRWAAPRAVMSLLAGAHYAGALAALARSDFQAAARQAAGISPAGDVTSCPPYSGWALLDVVEAALRAGQAADADAHVLAARQAGLAAASPRLALLSGAAIAMTAPDDEAPALFDLALAAGDGGQWPFERARVRLLAGERLRRLRAVTTARVHLGAALDEFRRLGAGSWAARAAMELRAAGLASPDADQCGHQVLSPQELEIARLAAAGLSNKEIGGRLFMSHRTVASHLYKMFPKLGISSRAALGQALLRADG